jgi:hypothetical protein
MFYKETTANSAQSNFVEIRIQPKKSLFKVWGGGRGGSDLNLLGLQEGLIEDGLCKLPPTSHDPIY